MQRQHPSARDPWRPGWRLTVLKIDGQSSIEEIEGPMRVRVRAGTLVVRYLLNAGGNSLSRCTGAYVRVGLPHPACRNPRRSTEVEKQRNEARSVALGALLRGTSVAPTMFARIGAGGRRWGEMPCVAGGRVPSRVSRWPPWSVSACRSV